MKRGLQGKWVKRTEVEAHQAFVPNALPPLPPLDLAAFAALTERANRALGRLDGVSTMLPEKHEQQIREIDGPSKLSVMAVYQQLRQRPIVDAKTLTAGAGVTPPTTLKALERLTQLGLVQEISGRQSRRIFAYRPLLALLQNDLPL